MLSEPPTLHAAPDSLALAQVVTARLCHDLGGPAGALGGALELLDGAGDDALEVARDAARILDRRLRFWRAAVGGTLGELHADALAGLLEGLTLGRRARVETSGLLLREALPAPLAQGLMLGAWAGVEALPRGGVVHVAGDAASGITLLPEGPGAAWPHGLAAALAGEAPVLEPRGVVVPLLLANAAALGLRLDLLLGAGPGPAPLLILAR